MAGIDWAFVSRLVYDIVLVAVCAAAIRHGEYEERLGAAVMVLSSGGTAVAYPISVVLGFHTRPFSIAIDVATLVAFDWIMVRSRKFWPLWAAGAILAVVSLDVAVSVLPTELYPYFLLRGKFAYVELLALYVGTRKTRRQRITSSSVPLDDVEPYRPS